MSTFAYATLTTARDNADPGTSSTTGSPGVSTYVDALAGLVPAEVLTLHAVVLTVTTKTENATIQITARDTLSWAFFGLIVLSVLLYVVPRIMAKKWDNWDYVRTFIPPLAFVGWTMLQRATAFDAVFPNMTDATRTVLALFLGVVLGFVAAALAYKADQNPQGLQPEELQPEELQPAGPAGPAGPA